MKNGYNLFIVGLTNKKEAMLIKLPLQKISKEIVSLPIYYGLDMTSQNKIIKAINYLLFSFQFRMTQYLLYNFSSYKLEQ